MKKKYQEGTVMWFIFLISGGIFIYIGTCAKLLKMILAGILFSVGSIISLYYLYSHEKNNHKNDH